MYRTVRRAMLAGAVTVASTLALAGAAQAAPAPLAPIDPTSIYVAGSSDTFQDVVVDPTSTTAYFTVPASNQVDVLNLKKGTWSKPIPVGSDPHGLDITPDGQTLLVADAGGATITEVNLKNDHVTTITTPSGFLSNTAYSIAALNNGTALFTTTFQGSGFGASAYVLDLATGAISAVPGIGLVTEATPLSRSADYSTAAAVLGDDSGGPFDVYSAATGTVVSGSLNSFISSSALSGDGSALLVDGVYVINAATGSLLGTISSPGGSSVLNSDGTVGYTLSGSSLIELDVARFLTGQTVTLPEPASGGGELAISPNGHYLVAETSGGATVIKL